MEAAVYIRSLLSQGPVTTRAHRGKHIITEQYKTPEAAAKRLKDLDAAGYDTFVQTARYGAERKDNGMIARTDTNVKGSSNIDLDVDVGPGKAYATVEEAIEAVDQVLNGLDILEPSLIIMSGHGVRYVWHFSTELVPAAWRIEADYLCRKLLGAGLVFDTVVMKDIKRAIRVPGLRNRKDPDNPVQVQLIHQGETLSIEEFRETLYTNYELATQVSPADLRSGSRAKKIHYRIENIGDKCPRLKATLDAGGADDDEPAWVMWLQLLACAEDGKDWIHRISDQHPTYDPHDTEEKFSQRFDASGETHAGPPLCTTLAGPECQNCSHRTTITTPARLGEVVEGDLPPGYVTSKNGTFLITEDGNVFVSATRFVSATLARLRTDGAADHKNGRLVMKIQFLTPGHKRGEVIMPADALSSDRAYRSVLLEEGINATSGNRQGDPLKAMLGTWLEHLQRTNRSKHIIERIGWVDVGDERASRAFALPKAVYKNGSIVPDEVPHISASLEQAFTTKGTLEAWSKGAQAVVDGGSTALSLPFAIGFAAPLMVFTNVSGAIVGLSSSESGTGKSTALAGGAAIWGDPRHGVLLADDTINSVLSKIGQSPCFPVFWDEIFVQWSPDRARELITNVFRLAQGREKSRMRQTREIITGGQWQTLICVASNYRVMDAVRTVKEQAQANMTRVIECDVRRIKRPVADVDLLRDNFGHAGVIYAKWLSQNAASLPELVRKHQYRIMKTYFRNDVQTRFWSATIATIEIGARIAAKLGLVRLPIEKMRATLLDAVDDQLAHNVQSQSTHVVDVLVTYLSETRERMYAFVWHNGKNEDGGCWSHTTPTPGRAITAYHYLSNNQWEISLRAFRQWLSERSYNATEVIKELKKLPGCTMQRVQMGLHSDLPSGRQHCLIINGKEKAFRKSGMTQLGRVAKIGGGAPP